MATLSEFEWYDAWILAAVVYASEVDAPVPLWRLIALADALNKAIVSRGELELGIGRLLGAREWSAQAEMPRVTTATYVTAEAYEKAVKRYGKQYWKEYRNRAKESDA